MKHGESTAAIATLPDADPTTAIDRNAGKSMTLSQGIACFCSKESVGNLLIRRGDLNLEIYVHKDDAINLRAELDALDETEHPWGPFLTYERHLDYILSQYDTAIILRKEVLSHA
jgi:hypothetical protein